MQWNAPPPDRIWRAGRPTTALPGKSFCSSATASAALGVPIYPVDADGFALCDAMFGILPEVHLPDRGSGSTDGAEYYKYNPHKEG